MSDMQDLESISPAKLNKLITSILNVTDNESPTTVVYALAGCLGLIASRFREPQAVLSLANDMILKAMQDESTLHNIKLDGGIH